MISLIDLNSVYFLSGIKEAKTYSKVSLFYGFEISDTLEEVNFLNTSFETTLGTTVVDFVY